MCSFLVNTTPAAPQTLAQTVREFSQDVRFGFYAGGWLNNFPTQSWGFLNFPRFLGSLRNLSDNSSPTSIEIFPGAVSVKQGEEIAFSAIGYDSEGEALSGIDFSWQVADTGRGLMARPLEKGKFKAKVIGTFTVTATSGGSQAQVQITVTPSVAGSPNQPSLTQMTPLEISSRSTEKKTVEPKEPWGKFDFPESVQNFNPTGSWNDNNWQTADDPGNLPGNPPGHPADEGAGNGNFQLSAPVISLPGRGIDLALNLHFLAMTIQR